MFVLVQSAGWRIWCRWNTSTRTHILRPSSIPLPLHPSSLSCCCFTYNALAYTRWDEWVDGTRLLKFNETNIALQKALQSQSQAAQAASASSSKAAKAAAAKDSTSASARGLGTKAGTRGTKRGREEVSMGSCVATLSGCLWTFVRQDEGTRKPEMKLTVPEQLKVLLVDDWEAVTKNNQVRVVICCVKLRRLKVSYLVSWLDSLENPMLSSSLMSSRPTSYHRPAQHRRCRAQARF